MKSNCIVLTSLAFLLGATAPSCRTDTKLPIAPASKQVNIDSLMIGENDISEVGSTCTLNAGQMYKLNMRAKDGNVRFSNQDPLVFQILAKRHGVEVMMQSQILAAEHTAGSVVISHDVKVTPTPGFAKMQILNGNEVLIERAIEVLEPSN